MRMQKYHEQYETECQNLLLDKAPSSIIGLNCNFFFQTKVLNQIGRKLWKSSSVLQLTTPYEKKALKKKQMFLYTHAL